MVEDGRSDCLQNRMHHFLQKILLDHYLPHYSLHLLHQELQPGSAVRTGCLAANCGAARFCASAETPPAIAELAQLLALTGWGIVITNSIVIMPIVTPIRNLILFIS